MNKMETGRQAGLGALSLMMAMGLTACGTKTLYDWGAYEDSLYLRYTDKNFGDAETYLKKSLQAASDQGRMPPGMYADYGYMLYRRGDYSGAIAAFEKEKKIFPESSALMAKLIERVRQKTVAKAEAEPFTSPAAGEAKP